MAAARADLDAFTDVAVTFAGDQPEPTLGAFIAYLAAAQQEEFGLETGRVGESDTVKLLTVHAAKGLQWPAVFIPGLAAGEKSRVFPARPKAPTRWTRNPRLIPFPLRGDAADLPALTALDADSVAEFNEACAARDLAEERRLAYVAATRAAFWLGCSGYWWGEATAPLGPSAFLTEVRAACEAGAGTVAQWADQPAQDAENPLLAEVDEADWPATPAGRQYAAVAAAAALVDEARTAARPAATPSPRPPSPRQATVTPHQRAGGAERAGAGADRGLGARHGPAARRARAAPRPRRRPRRGHAARPPVGVRPGRPGQGPGRAGPSGAPPDAAAARAAGAPRHRVPPVARGAVRPAAADRRRRPVRRGRRRPSRTRT